MKDNKKTIETVEKRIKYLRKQLNHSARYKHLHKEEHIVEMLDELEILEGKLDFLRGNCYTIEEVFG